MSETHLIEQAAMSGVDMEDDANLSFNDTRAKSQAIHNQESEGQLEQE